MKLKDIYNKHYLNKILANGFSCIIIFLTCYPLRTSVKDFIYNYSKNDYIHISLYPSWIADLENELNNRNVNIYDKLMVIGEGSLPYAFGSYSERYVYAMPGGVTLKEIDYVVKKYGDIDYVLIQNCITFDDIIKSKSNALRVNADWYLLKVK